MPTLSYKQIAYGSAALCAGTFAAVTWTGANIPIHNKIEQGRDKIGVLKDKAIGAKEKLVGTADEIKHEVKHEFGTAREALEDAKTRLDDAVENVRPAIDHAKTKMNEAIETDRPHLIDAQPKLDAVRESLSEAKVKLGEARVNLDLAKSAEERELKNKASEVAREFK